MGEGENFGFREEPQVVGNTINVFGNNNEERQRCRLSNGGGGERARTPQDTIDGDRPTAVKLGDRSGKTCVPEKNFPKTRKIAEHET